MFGELDLKYELSLLSRKIRKNEDTLVSEAKRILKQDLFAEKKILQHLKQYHMSFQVPDEEDLDPSNVFSIAEIKQLCVLYRLKFLEGNYYKPEVPEQAKGKIEDLNIEFRKEIKDYKILSSYGSFENNKARDQSLLFLKTNYDNYYLVHSWGKKLKKSRKFKFLPLRSFENLVITLALITLVIDLSLPTRLITLDHKATYWSGYRAAAFFHLLIFNSGVTVYFTFAFAKNFSNTVWNRYRDF